MDNVTAEQYEENLDKNLGDLLERLKSGSYVAPPVKRVYIPLLFRHQLPDTVF